MPRRHASRPTILLTAAGLLLLGCGDDRDTQDGAAGDDAGQEDAGQDAATVENPGPGDGDEDIPGRRDEGQGDTGLDDPGEGGAEDDDDGQDNDGQDAAGQGDAGQEGAGQEGAGEDGDGAASSPAMTGDTAGDFDDIPLPRGADDAGEKTERDGAISQSFFMQQTGPEEIMDFFSNALDADDWTVVEPVSERGTDSLAGAWTRDGRRLEISALLAQGVEDERTQFSVVLLQDLEPGEAVEGG